MIFFNFLEKILIKNLLNIKIEKIILEKIYVIIKIIFIYFQSNGFLVQIRQEINTKIEQKIILYFKIIRPPF